MEGFEARLKGVCRHVVDDAARLKVYETDGLTAKRMLPRCVALPETLDEVQAVMALCYREKVPVVARGAGTGLSGGAMPHPEGVLLSLAKFNRVLEVDVNNRIARVEPGVTNLGITEAVRQHDLYYAPDPSSQIACTIGGNIAENSGGVHCLKYGLTVNNVRALKMVSPEGELYEVGNGGFDSPGFDLLALLHGSEGMLGIVVEVTVQLLQKPDALAVVLAGFNSVQDASETVALIISEGLLPAGLEMMDKLAIQAAEDFVHAGYPRSAEALLLCELDGSESDVAAQLDQLRSLLEKGGATDIQVATEEAHRALLWQGRKSAFPAVGRIAPDYYCMDGTIPKRELADVLAQITALSDQYGLGVANVFHAGDGNLHPLILYDANEPEQAEAAEKFGADILELCIARGGTITGEHGVGVEKINEMCLQFSPLELSRFHQIKACFDETGLLNPGKAVPTLNRCAEFGAMHVHGGKLKHPELERF